MSEIVITDISYWQNRVVQDGHEVDLPIDFVQMKSQAHAVIIRAGRGNKSIDPCAQMNVQGASDAELPYCLYWAISPGDWKKHAQSIYEAWLIYDSKCPVGIDCEIDGGLSKVELEGWLSKLLAEVAEKTGHRPLIYTRKYWWDYELPRTDWAKQHELWVANYRDHGDPLIPLDWSETGHTWRIWQWSADGNDQGQRFGVHSDDIDLNRFQGDDQDFYNIFGVLPGELIPPPPPPLPEIVRSLRTINLRREPWGAIAGNLERLIEVSVSDLFVDSQGMTWYQSGPYWFSGKWSEIIK
jgi:GH25 family lysozyme M1 (1,4-beta-N-acetylmuramidase)